MTWDPKAPYKPEVQKCRDRLLHYCVGYGLDVGCGPEKITPSATGIDQAGADINMDLSAGLRTTFAPECFDYLFSSHCLEDFVPAAEILADWWGVIKVGGYLVLYLPHKALYPNKGEEGANRAHRNDFTPEDIIAFMDAQGASYEIVRQEVRGHDDEYSFDLVFRKVANADIGVRLPLAKQPEKKCLVLRWGTFGDYLFTTPVLPLLKRDGWHITYSTGQRGLEVLRNNPNIDEFQVVERGSVKDLGRYYANMEGEYDRVINYNATIETKFLFQPDLPWIYSPKRGWFRKESRSGYWWFGDRDDPEGDYYLSDSERRLKIGNQNYYRYACALAGYPDEKNPRPQLFASDLERAMTAFFADKMRDRFTIMWALSGSGLHKMYPFSDAVILALLKDIEDLQVITVGDSSAKMIEQARHPRWIKRCGSWPVRDTMLLTERVDLVVSPESLMLNAAGCFATPKIGMLTHSGRKQLVDTFVGDYSMQADLPCSPCHKMIYPDNMKDCPQFSYPDGFEIDACACCGAFDPADLYTRIISLYERWKERGTSPILLPKTQNLAAAVASLDNPQGAPSLLTH